MDVSSFFSIVELNISSRLFLFSTNKFIIFFRFSKSCFVKSFFINSTIFQYSCSFCLFSLKKRLFLFFRFSILKLISFNVRFQ